MTRLSVKFEDSGLKMGFVAKKLGVTRQTIYNWLEGTHQIPGEKLVRFADLLHCHPRELLGVKEVEDEVCV